MAETKQAVKRDDNHEVVDRARDFWGRNSKIILIASAAVILVCAGYLGYKYWVKLPKEQKAIEAMFKAEDYYRADSLNMALNGDGINAGVVLLDGLNDLALPHIPNHKLPVEGADQEPAIWEKRGGP